MNDKGNLTNERPPLLPVIIGTGLGSGFWPWGPGTAGSILGTLIWAPIAYMGGHGCLHATDLYATTRRDIHRVRHMGSGSTTTLLGRRPQPCSHRRDCGCMDSALSHHPLRRGKSQGRFLLVGSNSLSSLPLL